MKILIFFLLFYFTPKITSENLNNLQLDLDEQTDLHYLNLSSTPFAELGPYKKYTKGLLFAASNFTISPDPFPCTDLDENNKILVDFGNKTVFKICDLCPNLPFDKYTGVRLTTRENRSILFEKKNSDYPDCVVDCAESVQCVALVYNSEAYTCLGYNSTENEVLEEEESNFVTVVLNQPTGNLRNWIYSRNTKISPGTEINGVESYKSHNFITCLNDCEIKENCSSASFHFNTTFCTIFEENVINSTIDYVYGHISVFKITDLYEKYYIKNSWRFVQIKNPDESLDAKNIPDIITEKYNWIKNPACLIQPIAGCNQKTGMQKCFYPENFKNNGENLQSENLPTCPDSRFAFYKNENLQEASLELCYNSCLNSANCMGIKFSEKTTCELLTFERIMQIKNSEDADKKSNLYMLQFPLKNSGTKNKFLKYTPHLNQELVSNSGSNYPAENETICIEKCATRSSHSCSFNYKTKNCNYGTKEITGRIYDPNSITFLIKHLIKSVRAFFSLILNVELSGDHFKKSENKCKDRICQQTLDSCLSLCLEHEKCDFVAVKLKNLNLDCQFFTMDQITIDFDRMQQKEGLGFDIYVKNGFKKTDQFFTQNSLDSFGIFQPDDFYSCFRHSENKQTFSKLNEFSYSLEDEVKDIEKANSSSPALHSQRGGLRKKRFFDKIFNFFKEKIVEPVINVVKDIGKTIVKTGETLGKVFTGDFEGAKNSFLEIPLVQDVKSAIDSGAQIINGFKDGNWGEVGKGFLNLGADVVGLGLPGAGKIGGKIVKGIVNPKKAINGKGPVQKGSNNSKKKNENENRENKKKDKDKNNETCEAGPGSMKRGKRATDSKRKQCDDSDHCISGVVPNIDKSESNDCRKRARGKTCTYRCQPGYDEVLPRNPTCKALRGQAEWFPKLKCNTQSCGNSGFTVNVPHPSPGLEYRSNLPLYYVKYDTSKKLPIFTAAIHDAVNLITTVKRKGLNKWSEHPCQNLAGKQISDSQYTGSGWDRGHLTPYKAVGFSRKAALSSNMFVNAAPQDKYTNQVPWNHVVENHVYCFLKRNVGLVLTGTCSSTSQGKIGFKIPDCFWKLVCYKKDGKTRVVGFVAKNQKTTTNSEKSARYKETITLRSQKELIDLISKKSSIRSLNIPKAWGEAYIALAPNRIGGGGALINPVECATVMDIPKDVLKNWKSEVESAGGKKPNPPSSGRKKRSTDKMNGEYFGCSKEELKEYFAFLDSGSSINDEEDEDEGISDEDKEKFGEDSSSTSTFPSATCGKRLIGYFPSWGTTKFSYVQGKSLTHTVFAFFETLPDGSIKLGSADPKNSQNLNEDLEISKKRSGNFLKITQSFSHLKAMFAIGGWENSQYFSSIAADPGKRITLIASTIQILDQYNMDGIDIDWEHPGTGGAVEGIPEDKENYVTLFKELRGALDEHQSKTGRNEKYLISFAGAAGQWTLDPGLDLPNLLKYADWANVMTYDYFGAWDSKWGAYTGPPSPLYFGNPKGFSGKVNAHWTLKYYTCKTKSPHQITMGVPWYGRFWKNVGEPIDPEDGMWRKAEAVNGKFEGGFVPWKEIKSNYLNDPGFTVQMHPKAKVPYAWNPSTKTFLGFENPESLRHKVEYAEEYNLGGIMIWAIDQDDGDEMLNELKKADLCKITDKFKVNYRCPPIDEKRWWTPEDDTEKQGLCGKSAPLYKGYYPVCDPDDPGYSCCGEFGYCGSGPVFCDCPTCVDYLKNPEKIIEEPIKPTIPVAWYINSDPDGQRGRCGRQAPILKGEIPICNPDDRNNHCCSNGGYCGASPGHCKCDGCVDFKKDPNYKYKPKTWWEWGDGEDKSGRCGESAPKMDGKVAGCNPDSGNHCCSKSGWCGSGADFCDCDGCINYKL